MGHFGLKQDDLEYVCIWMGVVWSTVYIFCSDFILRINLIDIEYYIPKDKN